MQLKVMQRKKRENLVVALYMKLLYTQVYTVILLLLHYLCAENKWIIPIRLTQVIKVFFTVL